MLSKSRLLEAQFDYAAFYLRTLQQWQGQFHRADAPTARAAFEEDLQQIRQAQAWCAEHSQTLPAAAQLCSAFGSIDSALLESYHTPEAQIAWYRAAVDAARLLATPEAELDHLRYLTLSYGRRGDYAVGLQHAQEALAQHDRHPSGGPRVRAQLLNTIGDMLSATGEAQQAEAYFLESLSLSAAGGPERAHTLWGLSRVYNTITRLEDALRFAEQSRLLYQHLGNSARLAQIAGHMGEIRYTQGDYDAARDHQWESIRLAEQAGYVRGLTVAYRNLAYIASEHGAAHDAEHYFERSLAYVQHLGDLREHAILLGGLGQLLWRRGAYAEAAAHFRQSLALCEQTGDQIGMAYMLINLGKVHQQAGEFTQALRELEQAQAILERLGEPWGQAKVMMSLGELAQKQGDHARAAAHFEKMRGALETIGDVRGQTLAWIGLGKAEFGRGRADEALAAYQRALELGRSIAALPMVLEALLGFATVWHAQGNLQAAIELLGFLLNHPQNDDETRLACAALLDEVRMRQGGAPLDDLLAQGAQRDLDYFTAQQ